MISIARHLTSTHILLFTYCCIFIYPAKHVFPSYSLNPTSSHASHDARQASLTNLECHATVIQLNSHIHRRKTELKSVLAYKSASARCAHWRGDVVTGDRGKQHLRPGKMARLPSGARSSGEYMHVEVGGRGGGE